ncbi:gfo/Idh/MocA family oxidoreductase [Microbacterium sp. H1-D42]|uniref:gfo/Idh/MocA family oxidoreductase n=1 Tax=Microbacterium sp. H1-D42 TaxID=2925844 RepID=UPI001F5303AC|nr:gfo/Idh/MocA family oxidoreductase [Microbacterium sp. H1-D42]UNK71389.1 gfo/Idh/MocA family oxidoreductase [Microbacterium sp. H1-D42]
MTTRQLRFGLIGIDSSHAPQFTRVFRDGRVEGGRVVSAWQAPAVTDFPLSRRAEDHALVLPQLGVQLLETPEAVAAASDALLLVASDARTRFEHVRRLAPLGLPIYVDTRFSASPEETDALLRLAAEHDTLVLSGSPKRFTPEFAPVRAAEVETLELTGPMVAQPGHPGLAWYGVHLVDLAVAVFGPGCTRVEPAGERLRLEWPDGRSATIGGSAEWEPWTRGTARTVDGGTIDFAIEADEHMLIGLLNSVVESCRSGEPNITAPEIREISRVVAAGTAALADDAPVSLR